MREGLRIHLQKSVFVNGSMQLARQGGGYKCSSHTGALVVWSQYKLNARDHTSIAVNDMYAVHVGAKNSACLCTTITFSVN